jgi:regulator of nucleoside diphosphate kinase
VSASPAITLSTVDIQRLERILEDGNVPNSPNIEALREELSRAEVVEPQQMPAGVITMNSRVRLLNESTGKPHELTLVYPQAADGALGRVSVLAPVGSALLGLSTGQSIDWPMPDGTVSRLKVLEVLYQPESAGQYHI